MSSMTIIVRASNSLVDTLKAVPGIFNLWFGTFLLIMGNLSWMGNLIVFQSASFRNRAYTIYLLAETISDFFVINFILLIRILEKGYGLQINNTSGFICGVREAASYCLIVISVTFFAFASIDRVLATQRSNALRKWSNRVSLAYKIVIISTLFWIAVFIHRAFIYKIENGDCHSISILYGIIDNYMQAIFIEICPLITVLVLVYFLRRSLRNVVDRQANIVTLQKRENVIKQSQLQQIDSQLTLMLMLQSIVALITFLPFGCYIIYKRLITDTWEKTPLQTAIDKTFSHVSHVLSYTFFASSFHISIISCSGFRREFKRFFQRNKIHIVISGLAKAGKPPTIE